MNKRVICDSGMTGWQGKLQAQYENFDDFSYYDEMYGLAVRLGFATAQECWLVNPVVQGSTVPCDFRVVDGELDNQPNSP